MGRAVIDLQRNVQRLSGRAPGLFRLALDPEDAREDGQGGNALVILHTKTMGEAVEMAAVGHALDDFLGIHPRPMLIPGEVQGQHPQAVGAEVQ